MANSNKVWLLGQFTVLLVFFSGVYLGNWTEIMPYRIVKKEIHLCMELVPEERFCRTNIQNRDMEFQEYLGILNFSTGIWKYNKSWYVLRSTKVRFLCKFELHQIFGLESSNFRVLCNLKFQNWNFGIRDALLFH